ncbi:MAG: hypothetical protein HFJ01_13060 [Lachnospiraceae bacterium]|jgi:hypothetical protein|nr:hypothetical protein [Lachnospiraceae bacterium]
MKLLFAVLSILLFLIGVKTHKKIHAIAGIIFMAMLLISIATEMAAGSGAGVWIAELRESMTLNQNDPETAGEAAGAEEQAEAEEALESAEQIKPEAETGSAGQVEEKETPSPAKQPKQEESSIKKDAEKTAAPSPVKTASPSPEKKEEEKRYRPEDYGVVEMEKEEFYGKDGEVSYYYKMENFYLSDTFSRRVNAALQKIYDDYEAQYLRTAELIESGFDEFDESANPTLSAADTPYDYWQLVGLKYVGKDYISILYNDIPYMSNTHPYSRFDGITINCRTGKEVTASEFLEKSNEEILEEVSKKMGLEDTATWDDIDFYLTESSIVFIYRVPDWWEDVVMPRK